MINTAVSRSQNIAPITTHVETVCAQRDNHGVTMKRNALLLQSVVLLMMDVDHARLSSQAGLSVLLTRNATEHQPPALKMMDVETANVEMDSLSVQQQMHVWLNQSVASEVVIFVADVSKSTLHGFTAETPKNADKSMPTVLITMMDVVTAFVLLVSSGVQEIKNALKESTAHSMLSSMDVDHADATTTMLSSVPTLTLVWSHCLAGNSHTLVELQSFSQDLLSAKQQVNATKFQTVQVVKKSAELALAQEVNSSAPDSTDA